VWIFAAAGISMAAFQLFRMMAPNMEVKDEKAEKILEGLLDMTWYLLVAGFCYLLYLLRYAS